MLLLKKVASPGLHRTWIAINYGGAWYNAKPLTGQLVNYSYTVRVPNIRLNYYFVPLPPTANQLFNAYLSVTNLESKAITLDTLGVPIFNHTAKTWNTMNSSLTNLTLNPNQTQTMNVTQTLAPAYYSIWPSTCTTGYCFTPKTSAGVEMFWQGNVW